MDERVLQLQKALNDNGGAIMQGNMLLIDRAALTPDKIQALTNNPMISAASVKTATPTPSVLRPEVSLTTGGEVGANVSVANGASIGLSDTTLSVTFNPNASGADIEVIMFDVRQMYTNNTGKVYQSYTPKYFTPALLQGADITGTTSLNYDAAKPSFGTVQPNFVIKSMSLINNDSTKEPKSFSTFKMWKLESQGIFTGSAPTTIPIFQKSNVFNTSYRVGRYDANSLNMLVNGFNGIVFTVKDGDDGFRLEFTVAGANTSANISSI